jgi:hypothetical protein
MWVPNQHVKGQLSREVAAGAKSMVLMPDLTTTLTAQPDQDNSVVREVGRDTPGCELTSRSAAPSDSHRVSGMVQMQSCQEGHVRWEK